MNSVKDICDNFESLTNNSKITLNLLGGSRVDENKNKTILQSSVTYTLKKLKVCPNPFSNKVHLLLNAVINVFFELF